MRRAAARDESVVDCCAVERVREVTGSSDVEPRDRMASSWASITAEGVSFRALERKCSA